MLDAAPPPWPPAPLAPPYAIVDQVLVPNSAAPDIETVEARLVFRDWLDREVSVFARRSHPRHAPNGAAILHIVGGAQTIHPGDLAVWTAQGYAAASFDWQLTGVGGRPPERTTRFPAELVPQSSATPSLRAALIPVSLQAASVTLDWLSQAPGVDPDRLGVVGISWGGYLSWLLAAYDPRVRALVPAFGCGGLFVPGRAHPAHAPEVLAYWQQYWEPTALGPRLRAPVCYLNGTNDFFGDPLVAEELLATLRVPHVRHYLPNVDHSLDPAQTRLASAWFRQHLSPGSAGLPPGLFDPEPGRSPALPASPSASTWWTEDLEFPSKFRAWLPGPPATDRPTLSFTQDTTGGLTVSSPIRHSSLGMSGQPLAEARRHNTNTASGGGAVPFGLGWRWELGSTRHFSHDAYATPLASPAPGQTWLVTPARPQGDEPVSVLLHPHRRSLAALPPRADLRLAWSAEPADGVVSVHLHLLDSSTHGAALAWDRSTASLLLSCEAFQDLPANFSWAAVGRIQLSARQPRAPFSVGPLGP